MSDPLKDSPLPAPAEGGRPMSTSPALAGSGEQTEQRIAEIKHGLHLSSINSCRAPSAFEWERHTAWLLDQLTAARTEVEGLRADKEDKDEAEALLRRVAETQMALAVCDADMGRAAFRGTDDDLDAPTQEERDRLAEEADDVLDTILSRYGLIDPEFQSVSVLRSAGAQTEETR